MPIRLGSLLLIIAIAIALWQWAVMPRQRERPFLLLGALLLLVFPVEIHGAISNVRHENNTVVYNIFNLLEAYLVLLILHAIRRSWRNVFLAFAVIITAAYVVNREVNGGLGILLSDAIVLSAAILVFSCMATLWHLAETSDRSLLRSSHFWLVLGMLIYFAVLVPVIGLHRFVYYDDYETATKLYKIVPGSAVVRYLLAAFACHLATKRRLEILHG